MDCKQPLIEDPQPVVEDSIDPNNDPNHSMAAVMEDLEHANNKQTKKKDKKQTKKKEKKVMEPKKKVVPKQVRLMQEALAKQKEEEERQRRDEEERLRREEEERLRQEQLAREAEEARIRRREKKKEIMDQKRRDGIPVTRKQKQEADKSKRFLEQIKRKTQVEEPPQLNVVHESVEENKGKTEVVNEADKGDFLRAPICCIMGHVDAGKTKLLDCIRGTNVQKHEAGGITQQIGATYVPAENIQERIKELQGADDKHMKVSGLLLIDTPGHEQFSNFRSRGSSLCDIAVLVVDIMDGLKPQTVESLILLDSRNIEFIVALNKVDRLSGWKACPNAPIVKAMKQQSQDVKNEFNKKVEQVVTQFKEQGINTRLNLNENKRMRETYSIVPISAKSGEGIPDLLSLMVYWTQKSMAEKLTYSNEVQCTILEVEYVEGLGKTIDVILVNGVLHRGDQIVVCGDHGTPIVTRIQSLLTPEPMKELRVKGKYQHHSEIKAAQAIKITSPHGFEHAIAGTALYVVGPDDDLEEVKEAAIEDMRKYVPENNNNKSGSNSSSGDKGLKGVCAQASAKGNLEVMLEFLKAQDIPVRGTGIGPIHEMDVRKASVMREKKILAFDVKVTPEAKKLADELGVKIFVGNIIHQVINAYMKNLKDEKEKELAAVEEEAVFPCVLKILHVFHKKDPIIVGVKVLQGIVKVGTPLCIRQQRDFVVIGCIESIENNHRRVDMANMGDEVCIKIVGMNPNQRQMIFDRHFNSEDELVSYISRRSIDVLESCYRNDSSVDWKLLKKLKTIFKIL